MGAGRGGNFGNTKNKTFDFANNLAKTMEKYVLNESGFFGEKVNDTVRHIISEHPLVTMWDFVKKITEGATVIEMKNGKGWIANLPNGFRITYREKSSSDGSPAVEIWTSTKTRNASSTVEFKIGDNIVKIRYQKIHFILDD
ncbi:MAG: hypothetical protein IJQ16_09315 [Selenomonadaceae bacterium]|nr:hypothetical protein [Selenomonadaceae bacterium]